MATYYVGPGGNDANDGLSWAQRKLTLSGAEAIPVAPGDLVYVGPGVYRETLTAAVSGVAGNPIEYRGDYTGANTDGVGGVVRVTGSDDDRTPVRANAINYAFSHRTLKGFRLDSNTEPTIALSSSHVNVEDCYVEGGPNTSATINISGNTQGNIVVRRCYITGSGLSGIYFQSPSELVDTDSVVESCIINHYGGVYTFRVGGITVRNCLITAGNRGISIQSALAAGQAITVQNNVLAFCTEALRAVVADGSLVEDYNVLYANRTNYTNVTPGLNTVNYPPLFDSRWFFEAVNGGRLVTPFDLGQWSQLIDLAALNPPATDLRGTGQIGVARERGPLEYDTTLLDTCPAGGAGAVSISPYRGNL